LSRASDGGRPGGSATTIADEASETVANNVVVSAEPESCTVSPAWKPAPTTVTKLPAGPLVGSSELAENAPPVGGGCVGGVVATDRSVGSPVGMVSISACGP